MGQLDGRLSGEERKALEMELEAPWAAALLGNKFGSFLTKLVV